MKNFKGNNKQFARYLDSEYNDDYLEPLEEDDGYYGNYEEDYPTEELPKKAKDFEPLKDSKDKTSNQSKPTANTNKKPHSNAPKIKAQIPLTSSFIKDFVSLLGPEGRNCYYNLQEVKSIKSAQLFHTYGSEFYTKFATVPMLFLSFSPSERRLPVYLWQINKNCPYVKGTNHIVVDSRAQRADVMPHPSLLLLAKIIPAPGEEIMDAKFVGDTQLLVRSFSTASEVILRLYKITDFFSRAKINPYMQETLANDLHTYKLEIKRHIDEKEEKEGNDMLEANLYYRKTVDELTAESLSINKEGMQNAPPPQAEILLKQKIYKGPEQPINLKDLAFSEVFFDEENEMAVLIDKDTSTILKWQNKIFTISCFGEVIGPIKSVFFFDEFKSFFLTEDDNIYKISFKTCSEREVIEKKVKISPYPTTLQNIKQQSSKTFAFFKANAEPFVISLEDTVFRIISIEQGVEYYKLDLKDKLEKTKVFTWGICKNISPPDSLMLVYMCDSFLHFHHILNVQSTDNPHSKGSGVDKTINTSFTGTEASRIWDIIGMDQRMFLCGKFPDKFDVQLIELDINYPTAAYVNNDYISLFNRITKESDVLRLDFSDNLFTQIEGSKGNIVFMKFSNQPFYLDNYNLMFESETALVNPQEEAKPNTNKNAPVKEEENEKESGEKFIQKMQKVKTGVVHNKDSKTAFEESKDALKELRKNISSKMGQVKKFDDEYAKNEKAMKKENKTEEEKAKAPKEPKGVTKGSLDLYQEIKTEKKKMAKNREKEKTQRKKDRAGN